MPKKLTPQEQYDRAVTKFQEARQECTRIALDIVEREMGLDELKDKYKQAQSNRSLWYATMNTYGKALPSE